MGTKNNSILKIKRFFIRRTARKRNRPKTARNPFFCKRSKNPLSPKYYKNP